MSDASEGVEASGESVGRLCKTGLKLIAALDVMMVSSEVAKQSSGVGDPL